MGSDHRGYEVRVQGHLDDTWTGRLGNWALHRHPDGTTSLAAEDPDQAQLHGLLAALRDLNATLLSVTTIPEPEAAHRGPGSTKRDSGPG